jgi:hypothetical protein
MRPACLVSPLPEEPRESCRVVETLADDSPCPAPASPAGSTTDRTAGWHRDLGLDAAGRRRCEILPATLFAPGWSVLEQDDADLDARRCEHGRIVLPGVELQGGPVELECSSSR